MYWRVVVSTRTLRPANCARFASFPLQVPPSGATSRNRRHMRTPVHARPMARQPPRTRASTFSITSPALPFGIIAHRRDEATGGLYARWGYDRIRRTEFAHTRPCLRSWPFDSLSLLPSFLLKYRKDRGGSLGRRFRGCILHVRYHFRPVRRGRTRHRPASGQAGHLKESKVARLSRHGLDL